MKKYLVQVIVGIFSVIISFISSYCLFKNVIIKVIGVHSFTNIIITLTMAAIIYTCILKFYYGKNSKYNIDLIAILYFLMVVSLSLFRYKHSMAIMILNPISLINDFRVNFIQTLILFLGNILVYVPLGSYVKYRFNINKYELSMEFLIYILIIENLQYITLRGVFDITDIITNLLGFYIGILLVESYRKKKLNSRGKTCI